MDSLHKIAVERLHALNGATFPTEVVCRVACIDGNTFTNYTRKTGLRLCAETRQGQKSQLCLIDVYQIVLMAELTKVNRSPAFNAELLNDALFKEAVLKSLGPGVARAKQIPARFCADIFATPKPYWHRDRAAPYFAVLASELMTGGIKWVTKLPTFDFGAGGLGCTALVCNVTARLQEADLWLFEHVKKGGSDD